MSECKHLEFDAFVEVNRLVDSGRFSADIRVRCRDCELPFVFRGLPLGVNLNGAAMSADGTEARLAIAPQDESNHPLAGLTGFRVRKPQ
ncbi:hypothetical protein LCGC14_1864690 [marine sediment metagenome]|uniref:Uncharacterized protein n=1 Tax=marine sediment metagenome TaxID=412755 RepID=A0A0F9GUT5_9ZZZZ